MKRISIKSLYFLEETFSSFRGDSRVKRFRKCLRRGEKFPPILIWPIDSSSLNEHYETLKRRSPPKVSQKYFIMNGHHWTSAFKLEGRKYIIAKIGKFGGSTN